MESDQLKIDNDVMYTTGSTVCCNNNAAQYGKNEILVKKTSATKFAAKIAAIAWS